MFLGKEFQKRLQETFESTRMPEFLEEKLEHSFIMHEGIVLKFLAIYVRALYLPLEIILFTDCIFLSLFYLFFKGDVEAFVKALQNNKKSPSGDEQKKKDEEEDMALD